MPFTSIDKLQQRVLVEDSTTHLLHTDNITITFWEFAEGVKIPEHSHHNEQICQVTEGIFELTVDGESKRMEPGNLAIIPSNSVHSGKSVTRCRVQDVFYPTRDDYR